MHDSDTSTRLEAERASAFSPVPGQVFRDRYRVLRALGRGGFGVTYLARDIQLPGTPLCVIKQLCPRVDSPAVLKRACERFEREAKILSQLGSHGQVPRLLDYFQVQGEFYLVQEYIRGQTLAKEVRQYGPMPEAKVKQFLQEILPVLQYLHAHQVVHRDIKPPNIIRCQDDGRLVLIDFGAVKEQITTVQASTHVGMTTQFVGTVGFAPPEQLALRPTYATDIYAIGITCLYMLTGKAPMEFDYDLDSGELYWQQVVQVSPPFAKIMGKMLRMSLRDRYQSVDKVLRDLELEPYEEKLKICLAKQDPRVMPNYLPDPDPSEELHKPYSPFAKPARQIRELRARQLQKQQDLRHPYPGWPTPGLFPSSYL